jgi:hypothetical protein
MIIVGDHVECDIVEAIVCAVIIRLISPKFGKMTATQQQVRLSHLSIRICIR